METSLKTGFAQIFSRCPKNLSCTKHSPPRPPPPSPRPPGPYAYGNFGHSTCPMERSCDSGCSDPTLATARLVFVLVSRIQKSGTSGRTKPKWSVSCFVSTEISGILCVEWKVHTFLPHVTSATGLLR